MVQEDSLLEGIPEEKMNTFLEDSLLKGIHITKEKLRQKKMSLMT